MSSWPPSATVVCGKGFVVRSPLSDAVVRCQARRLRRTAATGPLPASLLAIAVAVAPIVFVHLGRALAGELAGAAASADVAAAVVLGPVLAAAVAGAAFASSLPERESYGGQIATAPFDATAGVVAVIVVPVVALAVVVVPSLVAASLGLGAGLPGGLTAGLALAGAVLAALPAGACVAEGALALARRRRRRALAVAAGALGWLAAGAALGSAPLGPLAACGTALRGALPAPLALAVSGAVGTGLALAWVALAAGRPPRAGRHARRGRALVRGRSTALPVALASLLARRSDVKAGAALAVAFGAAGAAVAVLAAAPAPAAFLLGTTTALLGSVLCALAIGGALVAGRWLWAATPRGCDAVARSAVLVSLVGSAAPVALVGLGAGLASGAPRGSVGAVAGVVVAGASLAVVAGALVPWQEGAADQLTTFAAFAALALAVSLGVGLSAPRLVSVGVPDAVVLALVCASCVAAAAVATRGRLERRQP
jgi:hypothetical protein